MGGVGYGLDFELGEELKLVLINGRFLAISCDDDVGCMKREVTLTFSIECDGFGGEWEGEGVGSDLVGLVIEQ